MATKYLDLDSLVGDDISVRLNGATHQYKEMSVEDFIWAQKKTESIGDGGEVATESSQVNLMIQIIQRSFPTISQDELVKVSMTRLTALVDFVLSLAAPKEESTSAGKDGDSGNVPSPTEVSPS